MDADPVLLALGRCRYGDRVEFVDADLTGAAWSQHVPPTVDAAVSTTALHWLDPGPLAALYRVLAGLLRPGGVFVDGDHFPLADPALHEMALTVRQGRATRAGIADREDWAAWWAAVGEDPVLAGVVDERSDRAIAHHGGNQLPVDRTRGTVALGRFRQRGHVWQGGDDQVGGDRGVVRSGPRRRWRPGLGP